MNKINIIVITIFILGLLIFYNMFQTEHAKLQHNFKTIDSLKQEIQKVDSLHKVKDSTIIVYKDSIIYMEDIIHDKKNELTKIKSKYAKIHPIIVKYDNTQLDSFFSNRYGY
jgi:Ni,Fe-hydrogenase I cytochrome b subunit